ncbi:MAG: DUF2975 domain-containing protein [Elusimicrobiaceae bacterium]
MENKRMELVKGYARIIRFFVGIALALCLAALFLVVGSVLAYGMGGNNLAEIVVGAMRDGVGIWMYFVMWLLLSNIIAGRIFEMANVQKLKTIAYLNMASIGMSLSSMFAGTYLKGWDIEVINHDINSAGSKITMVFVFLVIAYILEEACRQHEEGKLVI